MSYEPIKIVGAGLAGTTLAWQLLWENIPFEIYDNKGRTTAKAAAGLVNPVVFRRLNKSWMADSLVPFAHSFYEKVNQTLSTSVWAKIPIRKVIRDNENANDWGIRINDPNYNQYFGQISQGENEAIIAPFGIGEIKQSAFLNINNFINDSLNYFREQKGICVLEESFDYENILPTDKIIFAEGHGLKVNPYFNYLPLNGTHGETLIIKTSQLSISHVLNKNMFVLPLGDDHYKIGATYNWEKKTPEITDHGKKELLNRLNSFTNFKYEVVDHFAGIRPTVKDRRPLIGQHPIHKNLYVFNGLGTKGVMLAPYFAAHFLDFFLAKTNLLNEVNITRFAQELNQ